VLISKELVSAGYDAQDASGRHHHYLLRAAKAGLLKPGEALDLGCGSGRRATAELAHAGFRVTGLDVSPRSIDIARRELPGVRFVVGDMAAATFRAESFDLVTAFYSIIHLPAEEHAALLRRVAAWLRPGGGFIASLSSDHRTNRRLITDAGLQILVDTVETTMEDGQPVASHWVIACKP
jgi:SAM-dependent methyltransferase